MVGDVAAASHVLVRQAECAQHLAREHIDGAGHTLGLGIREFLYAPSAVDDGAAPSLGMDGGTRGRDDHDYGLLHRVGGLHLELHGVGERGRGRPGTQEAEGGGGDGGEGDGVAGCGDAGGDDEHGVWRRQVGMVRIWGIPITITFQ